MCSKYLRKVLRNLLDLSQGCNLVEVTICNVLVIVLCNKGRGIGAGKKKLTTYKKRAYLQS